MIASIAFYVFAAILLASAVMVVTAKNPVHSVLFLILAFFNAAALFLLAGAEFLAMILVIVYVGAVAVLFLFVVMMLDVNFAQLREGFQRYAPIGAVVGIILFVELAFVAGSWRLVPQMPDANSLSTGQSLSNTAALGAVIYTKYILLFQLAGLILLVAMIGAIVLTMREKHRAKRQVIARQVERHASDTLVMVSAIPGAGVAENSILRPEQVLQKSVDNPTLEPHQAHGTEGQ